MKLIIVESPTKAKTIGKFLNKDYKVISSYGHIRDLPKSKLGVDVENNFEPVYVIPPKAKDALSQIEKEIPKSKEVILAADEDREGESIAWHITEALGLEGSKQNVKRIVFHEITKQAIEEALKSPRGIDMNLVNAQQARRVLDRLVGYELSPFLWRKIKYGLSAGRVQSVAVRLVVEREREIQEFKKEEYWTIESDLSKDKNSETFKSKLRSINGKTLGKMDIKAGKEAEEIASGVKERKFLFVKSVLKKEFSRSPSPPFTTSTLQQEAARKFGFSAKQTMFAAQQLYENGLITYMRTDSVNLSNDALNQSRSAIKKLFGDKYFLPEPRRYKSKGKTQEAHEAIRPTNILKTAEGSEIKDKNQKRLYDIIWKRTIASQMKNALFEQTTADMETDDKKYLFRSTGQVIRFDGFIKVYTEGRDENGENGNGEKLPELKEGEKIKVIKTSPIQHFTEPPPRYTDATLVKTLEANGVGRPSTYAPTLTTIQERGYVEKKEKKYHPTEIGIIVNDILVEHFPEIVDINFTSKVEKELDEIAEGGKDWVDVCRDFYGPFKENLSKKEKNVEKYKEVSLTSCPHCGEKMIVKFGRAGKFLACPDPESKVTMPVPEEAKKIKELSEKNKEEKCPECGEKMEVKKSRFGFFLRCNKHPDCKGTSRIWERIGFKCPACKKGDVVVKKTRGRGRTFYACNLYPKCEFITNKKPKDEKELKELLKKWKDNKKDPKKKK